MSDIRNHISQFGRVPRKAGRDRAVLVNEKKAPGSYEVRFDAAALASGVYFYRLQARDFVQAKKLVILR